MKLRFAVHPLRLCFLIFGASCISVLLFINYTPEQQITFQVLADDDIREYLVDTPGCKMPSLNPWDSSISKFFSYSGLYRRCEGTPSFLRVLPGAVVSLDYTFLELYYEFEAEDLNCTYQVIKRAGNISDFTIDEEIALGPVQKLIFDVPMVNNFIKTICTLNENTNSKKREFIEFLALTPLKPSVETRCKQAKKDKQNKINLPNVLFWGIDSISRLNFIRHFPKTHKYLTEHLSPFSLKGYNKVGDNTFPNVMPLLTGHYYQYYWNETTNKTMYFDDVDFLWKEFSKIGYRTLLAEDAPGIATFNYYRSGFIKPPTDYYFRPFSLALENSGERYLQCLGSKMEMSVVHEYLKSFLETMNYTRPYLAFMFLARLTHDVFNFAGYADQPTFELLRYLHESNHLDNTILVFYSDHGIRFSSVRNTYIGQFEERRPFVHLVFPQWFKKKYKNAMKNLKINEKRLTTPFDIHATILELLQMQNPKLSEEPILEGPGISLFHEVSSHRTCEHATITPHWCTCQIRQSVSTDDKLVVKAAITVVDTINQWTKPLRKKCSPLVLKTIHDARVSQSHDSSLNATAKVDYLLVLSVLPSSALFEATVRCDTIENSCAVVDDISRINMYGTQSQCITDTVLKKFCYCL